MTKRSEHRLAYILLWVLAVGGPILAGLTFWRTANAGTGALVFLGSIPILGGAALKNWQDIK